MAEGWAHVVAVLLGSAKPNNADDGAGGWAMGRVRHVTRAGPLGLSPTRHNSDGIRAAVDRWPKAMPPLWGVLLAVCQIQGPIDFAVARTAELATGRFRADGL